MEHHILIGLLVITIGILLAVVCRTLYLRKLYSSDRYIAARKNAGTFLDQIKKLDTSYASTDIIGQLKEMFHQTFTYLGNYPRRDGDIIKAFKLYGELELWAKEHNKRFIEEELARCRKFFDGIADYPLDDQQRTACVVDEFNNLVVAGAGSGKTTTIIAKVRYLIERRGVQPSQILLIAFTKKAAEEMSERLRQSMPGMDISAMTFHKLGLELIKPVLPGDSYDIKDQELMLEVITNYFSKNDISAAEYDKIISFFAYYLHADEPVENSDTFGDHIEKIQGMNFETIKSLTGHVKGKEVYSNKAGKKVTIGGETVKSMEEVSIANFLFLSGIKYEYESIYNKPYKSKEKKRVYKPDFYLPDYDIYIEHFGVDENGRPPSWFSPVERDKYRESMSWKSGIHLENGTKLIESYSWWSKGDRLLANLQEKLVASGVKITTVDRAYVLKKILESQRKSSISELYNLISTFLCLYKSNGYGEAEFDVIAKKKAKTPHNQERQELFSKMVKPIFVEYEKQLRAASAIDFNDMINLAASHVEKGAISGLPYKYIIIDEYQDISVGRYRLVKAIRKQTKAKVFCVGDDWQSVYRFTGSDLKLFTSFEEYFGKTALTRIENTYRNSQELIDVMGRFVMMNPLQIKKELKSVKHLPAPVQPIIYGDYNEALEAAFHDIRTEAKGADVTVYLLGRTKYDTDKLTCHPGIKEGPDGIYKATKFPELKLSFLTVHGSKGLEADYVILLNAINDLLGFPNRIADDPVLSMVLTTEDDYDFAEERRLFYVALTRTRNRSYILAPETGFSPFMEDLVKCNAAKPVILKSCNGIFDGIECPKCATGRLVPRDNKADGGSFMGCTHYPHCDYTVSSFVKEKTIKCSRCGGFLLPRTNRQTQETFLGCSNYPFCKETKP
jgi:DNA helicase-4